MSMTEIRLPSKVTLRKYGLTVEGWLNFYNRHDGRCWICKKPFDGSDRGWKPRKACVDHEHVKDFKEMSDEEKAKHLRGMLCFQCNRLIVQKTNTLENLRNAVAYLEEYEKTK